MQYQFGYNCSQFIPYFKKCRVHVNGYRKREDLVEEKELKTNEIMIYLGLSEEDLLEKVKTGEIKIKKKKKNNGTPIFKASVAFKYDNCPLALNAGLCKYFEEHTGKKISNLMEKAQFLPSIFKVGRPMMFALSLCFFQDILPI